MATLNTEKKRGKDYCRLWFTSNGKRHPIALGYAANKKQLRSYEKIAEIVSEIEIYKKTNQSGYVLSHVRKISSTGILWKQ